jgi:RHS repeat-associated protein
VQQSAQQYVWCGTELCEERSSSGATVDRRYFPEGEQLVGGYAYTRDHLGSIREMVGAFGVIRARYEYDPYGRKTTLINDKESDFGYTGHFAHAPSGMHLAMFRAYDSGTARWLSRDPLGESEGLNSYLYVANDPVNYFDPNGLWGIQFGNVNLGVGDPNLAFNAESWDEIGQGAQAVLDGIIPFADPFRNNGGYDPCDKSLKWSKRLGAFARDVYLSSLFSGLFSAGKNSLFWSGGTSARLAAIDLAKATGYKTLSMTPGGKVLKWVSNVLIERGVRYSVIQPICKLASANFALNAKGNAVAVITRFRPSSIWTTVERPILMFRRLWGF